MSRRGVTLLAAALLVGACAAAWLVGLKHYRTAALEQARMPRGWHKVGSPDYEAGADRQVRHGGSGSAYVRFKAAGGGGDKPGPPAPHFGALIQRFKAEAYRGKTLRMSAYLKTEEAERAGLWLRVDGFRSIGLRFDNMDDRTVRGTTDWRRYEITLDVPEESMLIFYGALLSGRGRVWVDDFRFEVDGKDVGEAAGGGADDRPLNTDFEQ